MSRLISIKYTNFCKTNRNAPLLAKLEVLDKCVYSALIHGCETWGKFNNDIKLCYRSGLKTALNVRQNINDEIVYIEFWKWPLSARIKKSQLKFWKSVNEYVLNYPESALAKILTIGIDNNINYLKYYIDLRTEFSDPFSYREYVCRF